MSTQKVVNAPLGSYPVRVTRLANNDLLQHVVAVDSSDNPIGGFNIPDHDYIDLTYTGSDLTGVVYKSGGSGGTTVATLTLAYSGSNLVSVTKT